jgi:thiamine monophosphate kinase
MINVPPAGSPVNIPVPAHTPPAPRKRRETQLQRAIRELEEARDGLLAALEHAAKAAEHRDAADLALLLSREALHGARKAVASADGNLRWVRAGGGSK